jgi:hypothetical protein
MIKSVTLQGESAELALFIFVEGAVLASQKPTHFLKPHCIKSNGTLQLNY